MHSHTAKSSRSKSNWSRKRDSLALLQCQRLVPGYDRLAERRWLQVPLWNTPTRFRYAPGAYGAEHGVVVEHTPWIAEKRLITSAMMVFLPSRARR